MKNYKKQHDNRRVNQPKTDLVRTLVESLLGDSPKYLSPEWYRERAKWAYRKARYLGLNHRYPEGEQFLAHCPEYAYLYAKNVLYGGRFWKGEEVIKRHPEWACRYAIDILKDRWPEAEHYIAKDPYWKQQYEEGIRGLQDSKRRRRLGYS